MSFGPVTVFTLDTADVSAPGAPQLAARQISNTAGEVTLTPPTTDADGSPLTGITYAQIVVLQAGVDDAAYFREHFEEAAASNGAQAFERDIAEGAESISQAFVIALPGKPYSILARVADHPRA